MYTPKTTSILLLFIGILFGGAGLFAFFSFAGGISPLHTTFIKGEITTYSTSPQVKYSYGGQEYVNTTKGSMSCNNHPCNDIGDQVTIILDTMNPGQFSTLGEFIFSLIFPLVGIFMIIGWGVAYIKSRKRRDIILSLQSLGSSVEASIVDMRTQRSRSKRGHSRIIGYTYICRDIKTGEDYESDLIPEPIFDVGCSVRVVKDSQRYPGIYWVDLNTVRADATNHEVAQAYQENKNIMVQDEMRKMVGKSISHVSTLIISLAIGGFILLIAILSTSFALGFFALIIMGVGCVNVPYILRERKSKQIRMQNIVSVTTILGVEKYGDWKIIPLGYLPPNEKQSVDIDAINNGINQLTKNIYGYRYRFLINIGGIVKPTEVFHKPFPKKYKDGARIRVYFSDLSQSGEFVADLESIDELN